MSIKLFFAVLFLVDFLTLKYLSWRHFNAYATTRFNEWLSILLLINVISSILSFSSALMIYQYVGQEGQNSIVYLILIGFGTLGNSWFMWKRWKKARANSNTYDVTNDLILK